MQPAKAFSSSIGSKFLIAFTGLALLIFLIAHLAGNLLFLAGPAAFNEYSHKLISNPLIYVAEMGLVAVFLLHIVQTIGLVARSYSARPQGYAKRKWAKTKSDHSRKTIASSTMIPKADRIRPSRSTRRWSGKSCRSGPAAVMTARRTFIAATAGGKGRGLLKA